MKAREQNDNSMINWRSFTIAAFGAAFAIVLWFEAGCLCKAPQAGPAAPEVLVTTVQPRDVPPVLERVATLDGFINANINAPSSF
jgi:hypothetical protein